ncbi:uncharacterized protein CLAFUR5_07339 [Fulvia fulva]|uniref:Uncharacterized protein n=1 Tax=Passalora fulva TaxID=5499 RepID=A0A9Q8PAH1_PASFU|nr:uncharacterized protein CLAFUR5_07339 [Fulvia fulva]KAK4622643.1 hypothetical protein CLAFUR0_07210 [Fulvia fulva]UJO18899.1 hypothetical protein CLAFUR5_07339 [Fulvia fulva]WPV30812.1 hypothetical protein CLAFUW7_07206 [Fulvia fulva]
MKLHHRPGMTKRICVALLSPKRPYYITHEYGTITSFDDEVETLGELFDIVVRLKDRSVAKHLELMQTYKEVSKVMRKAINEWRWGKRNGRWATRLEELTMEHETPCTESMERAGCPYCYVKRYQHEIEREEVFVEDNFGRYLK